MKRIMKSIAVAFLVMAVIIAVQMGLTHLFSWHVGEIFSKTAMTALFVYCILRIDKAKR